LKSEALEMAEAYDNDIKG